MKTKISHVKLDNGQEIRVVEEGREGSTVFVRPLGEKEIDRGETVTFDPEEEHLVPTIPVYWATLQKTGEVGCKEDILTWVRVVPDGRNGSKEEILTWVRVVPDGRNGSTVYGRTLRSDEPDAGLAPQLRPGDNFAFRAGSLVLSVDNVDISAATKFEDGYSSIANTVYTWLSFYPNLNSKIIPKEVSYLLLSVARRLDASHEGFSLLHSKLKELETVEYGIRQRNLIFEIVGLVEIAIVAMNRAFQMADQLGNHFSLSTPFPTSVKHKLVAIKNMRDAYEHIDNRAFGLAGQKSKPHPDALSVFNFERLFQEGIATYGSYELDIYNEAIQLLIDTRQYLKDATSELASL